MNTVIAYHERVLATLRARLPDVPIVVVNELPTRGRFSGLNPLIREINPHVRRHAEKHRCEHLDFHHDVVDAHGELRADLTWDGLHLEESGYALFAERLRPLLVE
jgi:lysophospholipase L1-like esterase